MSRTVPTAPAHRQDRASSFRRRPWLCGCVCAAGLNLESEKKNKRKVICE
jgi:hypothetical protein